MGLLGVGLQGGGSAGKGWEAELMLLLRVVILRMSVFESGATYGATLQNLKYRNEFAHTKGRAFFHYFSAQGRKLMVCDSAIDSGRLEVDAVAVESVYSPHGSSKLPLETTARHAPLLQLVRPRPSLHAFCPPKPPPAPPRTSRSRSSLAHRFNPRLRMEATSI